HCGYEAVPRPVRIARRIRVRAGGIGAHVIAAEADDERVAAGQSDRGSASVALRRQGVEWMVPSAVRVAGVRRVAQAVALCRGAAIGAHVVGRCVQVDTGDEQGKAREQGFHETAVQIRRSGNSEARDPSRSAYQNREDEKRFLWAGISLPETPRYRKTRSASGT